jgi:quinol monooxygenase YgiN
MINRRTALRTAGASVVAMSLPGCAEFTLRRKKLPMYGLIGKMKTVPGQRDTLIANLLSATKDMPGCLSYIVAKDRTDSDALWITEVWDSEASHRASLALPAVQQAIAQSRALIAGFGERFQTEPIGGHGL